MSLTKKIAYNTIFQLLGKGVGTILGLVTIALMARYLGREGFGFYTTVITYLSFFGIIIEFGLHITTLQLVAEGNHENDRLISSIFTLRVISAIATFTLAPIVVWFFPYPMVIKLGVLVATGSFLFITLNQILIGILQINLRMDKASFSEVLGRIVLLIFVGITVFFGLDFIYIMSAIVLGSFANFIFNFFAARKYVRLHFCYDPKIWKLVLSRSWPIGASIFFNLLYLKADLLILSFVRPQEEVGIYGATYRFLDVLTTLPAMFMGLLLPVLRSSWVTKDRERFERVFQKAFDFMVIISIPMMFGTILTADKIILLIAGPEFVDSIPVLRIVILAIGAIFIGGGLYGYAIIALNKQRIMMWGYLATAVVSLSAYLYYIPRYSYFGAAWVTVFSEYFIAILVIIVVTRISKFIPNLSILFKVLFSSFIMSLVLYYLHSYNLFILVGMGILAYSITLYLLRGISKEMIVEVLKLKK